jgi:hypothetical protein
MKNPDETIYSSFYPLLLVLAALVLVNAVDTYGLMKNRSQVRAQIEQIQPVLTQVRETQTKLINLSNELLLLAPHSETAEAIVRYYGIKPIRQGSQQQD